MHNLFNNSEYEEYSKDPPENSVKIGFVLVFIGMILFVVGLRLIS